MIFILIGYLSGSSMVMGKFSSLDECLEVKKVHIEIAAEQFPEHKFTFKCKERK